jgi:hypothetical protein
MVQVGCESPSSRHQICAVKPSHPPIWRKEFNDYGCNIYAYPSSGGVIFRRNINIVELTYLGRDPFDPPEKRFEDQKAEDAFCNKLRKIGVKWWESVKRLKDVVFLDWDVTDPTERELRTRFFGWPDTRQGGGPVDTQDDIPGGVLVLEYEDEGDMPDDIGRLRMAVNMGERCRLMKERYGAKCFADPAVSGPRRSILSNECSPLVARRRPSCQWRGDEDSRGGSLVKGTSVAKGRRGLLSCSNAITRSAETVKASWRSLSFWCISIGSFMLVRTAAERHVSNRLNCQVHRQYIYASTVLWEAHSATQATGYYGSET